MAETVSGLVNEVIAQGSFDATQAQVLAWLNRRHKEMVNHARAYRDAVSIGTTTAGTQAYVVPAGIVELLEVTVGGVTWTRGRHTDVAADAGGWLHIAGSGGLVVPGANASNATVLHLIPVPTESGLAIAGQAVVSPPDLLLDNTVPLVVEDDLVEGLLAGVFATGLNRPGQGQGGEAANQLALFEAAKAEFKRRVARRLRGSGPVRIRVLGQNA